MKAFLTFFFAFILVGCSKTEAPSFVGSVDTIRSQDSFDTPPVCSSPSLHTISLPIDFRQIEATCTTETVFSDGRREIYSVDLQDLVLYGYPLVFFDNREMSAGAGNFEVLLTKDWVMFFNLFDGTFMYFAQAETGDFHKLVMFRQPVEVIKQMLQAVGEETSSEVQRPATTEGDIISRFKRVDAIMNKLPFIEALAYEDVYFGFDKQGNINPDVTIALPGAASGYASFPIYRYLLSDARTLRLFDVNNGNAIVFLEDLPEYRSTTILPRSSISESQRVEVTLNKSDALGLANYRLDYSFINGRAMDFQMSFPQGTVSQERGEELRIGVVVSGGGPEDGPDGGPGGGPGAPPSGVFGGDCSGTETEFGHRGLTSFFDFQALCP